jgi:hypothetical protein
VLEANVSFQGVVDHSDRTGACQPTNRSAGVIRATEFNKLNNTSAIPIHDFVCNLLKQEIPLVWCMLAETCRAFLSLFVLFFLHMLFNLLSDK